MSAASAASEGALTKNETGVKLFRDGKVEEATALLEKAVREDETYLPARINLAHAYERLNRFDEAIEQYRRVIALERQNFFAHNNLGVLLDRQGRYDEAIAEFEEALKSQPADPLAMRNIEPAKRSKTSIQERQTQIQWAEENARAKPQDADASYHVARVHASYGNKNLALQWLDRSLRQGYKESTQVKSDPAFANLRQDRDFELLLLGK
jgi:Tfp pilus assembly protein PilF